MKYAAAAAILAFVAHTASASPIYPGGTPPDEVRPDPTGLNGRPIAIGKRQDIEQQLGNPYLHELPDPTGPNGHPLAIGKRETIEQLAGNPLRQPAPEPTNILDTPIAIAKRQEDILQSIAGLQGLPPDARLPDPTGPNGHPLAIGKRQYIGPLGLNPQQTPAPLPTNAYGFPLAIGKRGKSKPTPLVVPGNEVHNARRGGVNGGGYINPGEPIGTFQPVIQRGVDANEDLAGIPGNPLGNPLMPQPTPTHDPAFGPIGPETAGEGGIARRIVGNLALGEVPLPALITSTPEQEVGADGIDKRQVNLALPTAAGLAPVPTIRHGLNKAEARDSVNGGGYIPTEPIGTLVPVIQRDSDESEPAKRFDQGYLLTNPDATQIPGALAELGVGA